MAKASAHLGLTYATHLPTTISWFRMPCGCMGYPQRATLVVDRVPDPAATSDFELPLLEFRSVDFDPTQVEFQGMLPRRRVSTAWIARNRDPRSVCVGLRLTHQLCPALGRAQVNRTNDPSCRPPDLVTAAQRFRHPHRRGAGPLSNHRYRMDPAACAPAQGRSRSRQSTATPVVRAKTVAEDQFRRPRGDDRAAREHTRGGLRPVARSATAVPRQILLPREADWPWR